MRKGLLRDLLNFLKAAINSLLLFVIFLTLRVYVIFNTLTDWLQNYKKIIDY